jgi:1,4-alpha-glucan branching enzyme
VPRNAYRIGVSGDGTWKTVFNSDSSYYGGGNVGIPAAEADGPGIHSQPYSVVLDLPPLGALVLKRE